MRLRGSSAIRTPLGTMRGGSEVQHHRRPLRAVDISGLNGAPFPWGEAWPLLARRGFALHPNA